jgi:hypothetical protein
VQFALVAVAPHLIKDQTKRMQPLAVVVAD